MMWDYNDFVDARLEKEAEAEAERPKCEACGEPIWDDEYFDIEGEILCTSCMKDRYMKFIG